MSKHKGARAVCFVYLRRTCVRLRRCAFCVLYLRFLSARMLNYKNGDYITLVVNKDKVQIQNSKVFIEDSIKK